MAKRRHPRFQVEGLEGRMGMAAPPAAGIKFTGTLTSDFGALVHLRPWSLDTTAGRDVAFTGSPTPPSRKNSSRLSGSQEFHGKLKVIKRGQ